MNRIRVIMPVLGCLIIITALISILGGSGLIAESTTHPDVILKDADGNAITATSQVPYSPKQTCGVCHDYDTISAGFHFQQGRLNAAGNMNVSDTFSSTSPWVKSDGMYGKW